MSALNELVPQARAQLRDLMGREPDLREISPYTAGALEYLPHWSAGAPSAIGPVNAFALARTPEAVMWP